MEIRYGFTLADLQRIAASATRNTRSMFGDFAERYAEAYGAMVEHLYASPEPLAEHDLYWAAQDGLRRQAAKDTSHRGIVRYEGGGTSEPGTAPNFCIYWDAKRVESSHEDRVVDRIALHQIWPALAPRQREVIGALAAFDDHEAARTALGDIPATAYRQAMALGRKRFLVLWHEGEMPSRIWSPDRRVGSDLRIALRHRRAKSARRARQATA